MPRQRRATPAELITASNKKIRAKKEVEATEKDYGIDASAGDEDLKKADSDLKTINPRTGMSAAAQARADARGTEYDFDRVSILKKGLKKARKPSKPNARALSMEAGRQKRFGTSNSRSMEPGIMLKLQTHIDNFHNSRGDRAETARKNIHSILRTGGVPDWPRATKVPCAVPNCKSTVPVGTKAAKTGEEGYRCVAHTVDQSVPDIWDSLGEQDKAKEKADAAVRKDNKKPAFTKVETTQGAPKTPGLKETRKIVGTGTKSRKKV